MDKYKMQDRLYDQIKGELNNRFRDFHSKHLNDQVESQVCGSVSQQLITYLYVSLRDQILDNVRQPIREEIGWFL